MAHFAELDENNVVLRVIVVDNKDTSDAGGGEKEHIGAAFCERVLGGRWVQTSYNEKIRKRYAGIGMVYLPEHDHFTFPQPTPEHEYDPNTGNWVIPGFTEGNLQVENVGGPN
jgi:hypothetical protein